MLHLLFESGDGNSELKGKRFPLGKNIYAHLKETLDNYKGDKSVEGYKRLVNIINMNDNEGGILYNEMKRIKNFFDNYNGSRDSVNYILNGGEPMENWVRNTLNTAIETVKGFKQAKAMGGLNNSFRKEHTKDRIVKPPKETKIKMSDINKNLLNVAGSGFKITKPNNVKTSVNEVKTLDEMWEESECTPYDILSEFKHEHQGKNDTISWKPLINPQQYQNALRNYMQYGDAMRFPERYIDEWLEIIARNLVKLNSCTELAGHSAYWPDEDFDDVYDEEYDEWYEENKDDLPTSVLNLDKDDDRVKFEFLEAIGLFDYLKLPDGSDAYSDFGIKPIVQILREYRDDMTSGEKLVLVNRCLDVAHCRGDLASAFIEGGKESCAQISNGGYQGVNEHKTSKRTFYITNEQISRIGLLNEDNEKLELFNEYELNYNKYQYLLRKPINKLTLDEITYLYAIHWIKDNPGLTLRLYDWELDNYIEKIKRTEGKLLTAAHEYFKNLKFPLKVYRGMRPSENINNLSGKKRSLSWTADSNIYSNEKSKFKHCDRIVEAEITPDMVQNEWSIVNFMLYSAKHYIDPDNNGYGEYELSLKPRFKYEKLDNLKQFC